MNYSKELAGLIDRKKTRIALVGLGYVGLPIALEFVKKGFFVYGLDNDKKRINSLVKGTSYITDISSDELKAAVKSGRFHPTTEQSVLKKSEAVIICVPTPLRKSKVPNISYIINASHTVAKYLRKGQLIILESTTYPGTSRDVVLPILEKGGLRESKDFFLAFSPERIDPGNKSYPFARIPKVVGGISREAGELTRRLYSKIIAKVIMVSSAETAEVIKLLENTFRIVNIGLINEFAMLCNRLKINVWEVVEAAKTKPFGFMPFYPGPGIGGHCLDGKESIFIKNGSGIEVTTMDSFIDKVDKDSLSLKKKINGVEYLRPSSSYKMLTYDTNTKEAVFKPISMLSKRKTDNDLFRIITKDNRRVAVTDAHPMFVLSGDRLEVRFARDLKIGDKIPFVLTAEYSIVRPNDICLRIDLIEALKKSPELIEKIRVRPCSFSWSLFKERIYKIKFGNKHYHDYTRYNRLPLKYFLYAEDNKILHIRHEELLLCSGRGPSYSQIPAVINIASDFCRLIGYYLSEGCITEDKSISVRFSFGSDEKECINDVCGILEKIGIRYSTYKFKKWKTVHIKISSNLFGILLRDVLRCGKDSYGMNIPDLFFTLPKAYKWELLKGLLRGDGGVDMDKGERAYQRNGRRYCHNHNSAGVNYFSSSKKLFNQIVFLLQEFGLVPTFKKREGLLYIYGYKQILKLKDVFLDDKKKKVERYLENSRKIIPNRGFQKHEGFATSTIKAIERVEGEYVYSAEIEDTHTIVTSYGTIVHNCIPADPLYLSWKARKVGFKTRMIDLAAKTNLFMPHYVVHRAERLLRDREKELSKARILVLGVTYKKDVKDLRESPALDIINTLQGRGAEASYSDPYIPHLDIGEIHMKSTRLTPASIRNYQLIILTTDHKSFNYKMIARNAGLILDTRNAFERAGIEAGHIRKL